MVFCKHCREEVFIPVDGRVLLTAKQDNANASVFLCAMNLDADSKTPHRHEV